MIDQQVDSEKRNSQNNIELKKLEAINSDQEMDNNKVEKQRDGIGPQVGIPDQDSFEEPKVIIQKKMSKQIISLISSSSMKFQPVSSQEKHDLEEKISELQKKLVRRRKQLVQVEKAIHQKKQEEEDLH